MAMRSPERAWARASVHAHSLPYAVSAEASNASMFAEAFQSHSWRT